MAVGQYEAFTEALRDMISGERFERAAELARRYWQEPFTGRYFHVVADSDHRDEITERDIVAVSLLGVTIPAPVTIWLLNEGRELVSGLLRQIPNDVDVWNADDAMNRDGALWRLWDVLSTASWPVPMAGNGMGRTKTSKLLAAKRPRLVPIFDSVLEALLPPVDNHWAAFATALSDGGLLLQLLF